MVRNGANLCVKMEKGMELRGDGSRIVQKLTKKCGGMVNGKEWRLYGMRTVRKNTKYITLLVKHTRG